MKMSNTQLTLQVLERDQRRSSLLAEALDEGENSPGGEEERQGEGSGDSRYLGGGLPSSYLAWCCARALGPHAGAQAPSGPRAGHPSTSRPCGRGEQR